MDQQDKSLINVQQDLVPLPMDLPTAKLVLETVVQIHENSYVEGSDFSEVGQYNTDQVREAMSVFAEHLMSSHTVMFLPLGSRQIKKQTAFGMLTLTCYGVRENLYMSLVNMNCFVLETEVPLIDIDFEDTFRQTAIRFSDFRRGTKVISMYDLNNMFTIEKFKHIRRGTRWLAANMLQWDGTFKFPEDLDNNLLTT